VLGCSAVGVIGGGREIERREAISVVLARLPEARVRVFHLETVPRDEAAWLAVTGVSPRDHDDATFLLMADPFSIELEAALERFDAAYPRAVKLGGVASGASAAGEGALYYKGALLRDGLVGVSIRGGHKLLPVVAQGCRPIGEPMIITRCRDSVIQELNVGRPIDALQRTFKSLPPRDQELGRHSLFVGIEMRSGAHRYTHGDFLVREVAGIDPQSGAMAIGGRCQDYQVVQFHLRDAQTSARDLEARLTTVTRDLGEQRAAAALIFSCLGRGAALYGEPNHDTDKVVSALGPLPVGGFFGGGEIGPVGGRTFLHGYTSAIAIFAPRE
jgi:small ligand-binding sensory domain FIST